MMSTSPDRQPAVLAMQRAGLRLTSARRTVAELIGAQAGHFTAADLLAEARRRRHAIGRATIFRSLELFAELGTLERLELQSGDHAYVACEPLHHHHVVCSSCGRTTEVDDCGMQTVVAEIGQRTGYLVDSHRLELFGFCPDCRTAPRPVTA